MPPRRGCYPDRGGSRRRTPPRLSRCRILSAQRRKHGLEQMLARLLRLLIRNVSPQYLRRAQSQCGERTRRRRQRPPAVCRKALGGGKLLAQSRGMRCCDGHTHRPGRYSQLPIHRLQRRQSLCKFLRRTRTDQPAGSARHGLRNRHPYTADHTPRHRRLSA